MTNTADFDDVLTTKEARVNTGDYLLTAVNKRNPRINFSDFCLFEFVVFNDFNGINRYILFWFTVVIDFKVSNGINNIHTFDDLSKDSIFGITSWVTTFL